MTLLSAFKILLARYTGEDDVCVGTAVAHRQHPDTEGLIGFFVNMLVLRTRLRRDESFESLLRRVRSTCFEAYAHQDLPFEQLVVALNPPRSLSYGRSFR
jgi:non-ribosomal peptide synthetase component F